MNLLTRGVPSLLLIMLISFSMSIWSANLVNLENSPEDIEAGELCKDCHEDQVAGLTETPHASALLPHQLEIGCISCHSGGAAHVEDPKVDNIGSPQNMEVGGIQKICMPCHQPHLQLNNTGFDPHISEGLSCLSCHSIHKGQDGLLREDPKELCGECHLAVINQFSRNSNHPLMDNSVSCLSCHDFTGKLEPMYAHGTSSNCASCHPMEGGPFLYEHGATSSFAVEGGDGCVSCHMPHGSPNDRLLTRPDNLLCQQCHGTPPGHVTAHSGRGVSFDCMECHDETHGSNDNRFLLDPNLGAKIGSGAGSCFCHNVSG